MQATLFPAQDFEVRCAQDAGDLADQLRVDSSPSCPEGVVDGGACGAASAGVDTATFPVRRNPANDFGIGNITGGEAQLLQVTGNFIERACWAPFSVGLINQLAPFRYLHKHASHRFT
ncbi:MAG: hypothetical protein Q4P23_02190 [Micrococcaceae bacterium]|nr:hypothetical protein [Micrococcaceae bacterium]